MTFLTIDAPEKVVNSFYCGKPNLFLQRIYVWYDMLSDQKRLIMTQLLQTAFDKAKSLSESEQDIIAALLLNAIAKKSNKRPIGLGIGLVDVPDDFNDPLPKEELAVWYEGHQDDPLSSLE